MTKEATDRTAAVRDTVRGEEVEVTNNDGVVERNARSSS
jgi:hypothetical protein